MVSASSVPFRLAFHTPFGSGMFECLPAKPRDGASMGFEKGERVQILTLNGHQRTQSKSAISLLLRLGRPHQF